MSCLFGGINRSLHHQLDLQPTSFYILDCRPCEPNKRYGGTFAEDIGLLLMFGASYPKTHNHLMTSLGHVAASLLGCSYSRCNQQCDSDECILQECLRSINWKLKAWSPHKFVLCSCI